MRLGIDFGTCFSSAAYIEGSTHTFIKDPVYQDLSIPSSIFVTPQEQVLVGKAANNRRLRDPLRYRHELKRDLGRTDPFLFGDHPYHIEELVTSVISKFKQDADTQITDAGGRPFTGAVLTIPSTFQEHKRISMLQAATQAGFAKEEVTLLEEPVAAAYYYAHQSKMTNGEILLVYDLGGGTFDTALLRKRGDDFEHLALPTGIERCGGIDFDRAIYHDIIRQHPELQDLLRETRNDEAAVRARATIGERCIDIKHQLSSKEEVEETFPVPGTGTFIKYSLTRTSFNQMIAATIEETITCCRNMIQRTTISQGQINRILLVGGSCRIPYVQQLVQKVFQRPVSVTHDLELVVSLGAALYATQHEVPMVSLSSHVSRVWGIAISLNGQTLVSGSSDQTVKVWDIQKKQLLHTLSNQTNKVYGVAISPDGQTFVSGNGDRTVKMWNLQTGQLLHTFTDHKDAVYGVAISPDGQTLVSGSQDQSIKVWNVPTGQRLYTLSGHSAYVWSVAFSPDGQTLASGSYDQTIKMWDMQRKQLLRTFSGHTGCIWGVAISPDGQTLVSGSADKTIRVWNIKTGECLRVIQNDTGVLCHAISPDGQTFASGSYDQTIKVWNLQTGELLRTLLGHTSYILCLAISSDGQTLVSGSQDQTIKVWRYK